MSDDKQAMLDKITADAKRDGAVEELERLRGVFDRRFNLVREQIDMHTSPETKSELTALSNGYRLGRMEIDQRLKELRD